MKRVFGIIGLLVTAAINAAPVGRMRTRGIRPLVVGVALAVAVAASAQTGGGYDLSWSTVDSGAGVAVGGGYTMAGIVGQPEAAPVAASGGGYSLVGGFLQPSNDPPARVGEWALY